MSLPTQAADDPVMIAPAVAVQAQSLPVADPSEMASAAAAAVTEQPAAPTNDPTLEKRTSCAKLASDTPDSFLSDPKLQVSSLFSTSSLGADVSGDGHWCLYTGRVQPCLL